MFHSIKISLFVVYTSKTQRISDICTARKYMDIGMQKCMLTLYYETYFRHIPPSTYVKKYS